MQCPHCGSQNTQRAEVAYHDGTQHITSNHVTQGLSSSGHVLGGVTSTSSVVRSTLAQQLAPPQQKRYTFSFILFLIGIAIGGLILAVSLSAAIVGPERSGIHADDLAVDFKFALGFLLVAAVFFFPVRSGWRYNHRVWPGLMDAWKRLWICFKCGSTYKATNGVYVHLENTDAAVKQVLLQYSQIQKKALGDTSLYNYETYYEWMALPMLLLLVTEIFLPDRKKVKQ